MAPNIHATAVRVGQHGVLIRGVSGAGKSRLALGLLDACDGVLIADDRVVLEKENGTLFASPHERLAGMIEMRGLGILKRPFEAHSPVHLVVSLAALINLERMPERPQTLLHGVTLPELKVPSGEPGGDLAHQVLMVKTALRALA